MTDEVSESMKIAVLISMCCVFLTSCIVVTIFAMAVLRDYQNDVEATFNRRNDVILGLQANEQNSGPECYKAIMISIDGIESVKVGSETYYSLKENIDKLQLLYSKHTGDFYTIKYEKGTVNPDQYRITLIEVN